MCGVSTYTVLGFAGYVAATALAVYLGAVWQLSLTERAIGCIAPPAAFVLTVAIGTALRSAETVVFYETACAAVGSVAVLAAIAGARGARLVDVATLGVGVFLVSGRLGCLSVACCHGTLGHGIVYGPSHVAIGFWARWSGRPLWPVQLVEAFASGLLVIAGLASSATAGTAAVIYIVGYALIRFPLELVRGDAARPYVLGVSEAQWFALATLVACALWRPSGATLAALVAVLLATCVLLAMRRRRELWSPAHLYELDRAMAAAREGATSETSLGVAVSRHALDGGQIDWVLSSRHPAWSTAAARRIAAALWQSFELIEGRGAGIVHVIAREGRARADRVEEDAVRDAPGSVTSLDPLLPAADPPRTRPSAETPLRLELLRVDRLFLHELERRGADDAGAANLARALVAEHGSTPAQHVKLEPPGVLPGLERAREIYLLSPLEREALLLALVPELDERYGRLLARIQGDGRRRITVGLAARWLAYLVEDDVAAALGALGPSGRLERMGLVDLVGDGPLPGRALAIPGAFWPCLVGLSPPPPFTISPIRDGALAALVLHRDTLRAAEAAIAWGRRRAAHDCLFVIDGAEGSGREALATAVASELGFQTLHVTAAQLQLDAEVRAVVRTAAWHLAAIVIRGPAMVDAASRLAREVSTPVFVFGDSAAVCELAGEGPRSVIAIEVRPLEQPERAALWERMLAQTPRAPDIAPHVLAAQFRFGPGRIRGVVAAATSASEARGDGLLRAGDLAAACRAGPTSPGALATRLDCPYEADDIELAPATRRELSLISAWAQHAATAFQPDAAGGRIKAHGGLVCLFAGPPGTGKTMAAQVLARSLQLSMLRIDLSQVVSKYIGETEKNLERVFADAEASGALLFFDEADALFGKRTEVSDAHDRYANLETAYLLQRLERHPGIMILATNLQHNLDAAFLRRIHVVAEFPMPGPAERAGIWERHLSREHLAEDVQIATLGTMFPLSGGDIRNATITAVLLAASDGAPVAMRHIAIGIWRELRKTGRMTSPDDFGKWRDVIVAYTRGP